MGLVIDEIPKDFVDEIIVVDNGSTDETFKIAEDAGATAITESQHGYGKACLTGIEYALKNDPRPDIIVFIDGDRSDYPDQLPKLVKPIINNEVDFVIGSRAKGNKEDGSMTFPQVFGNWLATTLLRWFYGAKFTDLGPFRAIRTSSLIALKMRDEDFGWTVEMQIKAVKKGLRYLEVPVNYRKRIGFSKISGTIKGTLSAGYKIIWTIIKYL